MVCAPLLLLMYVTYPVTYIGTRLGVTVTVVRYDDMNATLSLRTGPIRIASGRVVMSEGGKMTMDEKITRVLDACGVAIINVTPSDEEIAVRARMRLIGDVFIRLIKVQSSHT